MILKLTFKSGNFEKINTIKFFIRGRGLWYGEEEVFIDISNIDLIEVEE